jgi:hypothetical protein
MGKIVGSFVHNNGVETGWDAEGNIYLRGELEPPGGAVQVDNNLWTDGEREFRKNPETGEWEHRPALNAEPPSNNPLTGDDDPDLLPPPEPLFSNLGSRDPDPEGLLVPPVLNFAGEAREREAERQRRLEGNEVRREEYRRSLQPPTML